ncbi:ABC transporter ATP-binding protein [Aquibium sp. ELW1220]|uniref:ABC transporter ATP-binding protein n=1 Tax=Aquibium sp. ELW1220 TaxID=2976766 RepID=UPI0025AFD206|nr:ABC transporter ATP-binding protein [Aquibium sp. ELW1220]MDN2578968.1 ABC transporter ATP-binding protein/permease [Aquibium sp. ELW1220]
MRSSLAELFRQLSARRRRQFGMLLCLMLVGAVGELVSIGAVLPFLAVIADPQGVMQHARVQGFLHVFGIDTPVQIAVAAAILFAVAALGAAASRLLLVYVSQRFVFGVARDLSVAIFSRTLHQPYTYHTGQNSSETLAAINKAQLVAGQILMPLMQATAASVIAVFILAGLLFIDPLIALGSGLGFAAIYLLVMRITRKVMRANGDIIARAQGERLQAASEGLGGIRDVLLDRSQAAFVARFGETEARLRSAQALNNFIAQAPRFIVEGIGLALIAGLTLVLTLREGGLAAALPVLGALALGAQRLVPLMQQAYSGWAATLTGGPMLADILDILRLPDAPQFTAPRDRERLPFERDFVLSKVGFSYPQGGRPAVEGIDLVVQRGARVGLAGRTGSGKSTLMDLVLGLLSPDSGRILVDGVELNDANRAAWQARIAHVPQSIYLSDASIAENIAFGVPAGEIDRARVAAAAAKAELAEVIEALPQGYDTPVGERGVRLSGGQRQRVGIARALYKRADVLVFDEATSALDTETETAVMGAIGRLGRDLTIFIIAHRLSTLDGCDMVVTLDAGRVQSVMKSDENRRVVS